MNIGVIRERAEFDRRVALTPPVVGQLAEAGHTVWVETGAGDGAIYHDPEYIRAGAHIAYSPAEVLQRCQLVVKISTPTVGEIEHCEPGTVIMAFFHLAVADGHIFSKLLEHSITAVGCEIIQDEEGRLPVLAAISEIAGQMTVPLAAQLLRSSSGGRGILLGGSPGVPPAGIVILGAGTVGSWAARTAMAAGAYVTVLDTDPRKLRYLMHHVRNISTALADRESVASAVAQADVVIGAVLVAGSRTPHVVTEGMVERMKRGAAILDVSIDQGGCVETSRPTTIGQPTFVRHGVTHFCVPNFTADLGRSSSVAIAQAVLPYLSEIARHGISEAMRRCPDLGRGVYTHDGACVHTGLAEAWHA